MQLREVDKLLHFSGVVGIVYCLLEDVVIGKSLLIELVYKEVENFGQI